MIKKTSLYVHICVSILNSVSKKSDGVHVVTPLLCNWTSIMYNIIIIYTVILTILQWNLFIKDTLGPANLSTVERLSTLLR